MNAVSLIQFLVKDARGFHEETMKDVTPEQADWQPSGRAMPIAAQYAHVIATQDMGLHGMLKGMPPLAASSWSDKTGLSEMPPMGPGSPLDEWAARVQIDLPSLREDLQSRAVGYAMETCEGNKARAATLLGMSRTRLLRRVGGD